MTPPPRCHLARLGVRLGLALAGLLLAACASQDLDDLGRTSLGGARGHATLRASPRRPLLPFPTALVGDAPQLPPDFWASALPSEGPRLYIEDLRHALGLPLGKRWLILGDRHPTQAAPLDELPLGLYRLGDWWLDWDGTSLIRARRYPTEPEAIKEKLRRLGRHDPDEHDIRRHLQAGEELDRDIEAYLTLHGLALDAALRETRKTHEEILRQLVSAYATAFAVAATSPAMEATAQASSGKSRLAPGQGRLPRAGQGGGAKAEIRPPLWSPYAIAKPRPAPAVSKAWAKDFRRTKILPTDEHKRYEIRHAGGVNIDVEGGGETVRADGIAYDEAVLVEAKHISKPERSPYVPKSKFPSKQVTTPYEELDSEFRRYGAVINDPQMPAIGLKVITNHADAAEYFLGFMERWKVPGYIIIKE